MLLIGPTVKYNGPTFYNTHDNVSFNKYFFFILVIKRSL